MRHVEFVCAGCGAVLPPLEASPYPFACPEAKPGDDIDHVVRSFLPEEDSSAASDLSRTMDPFVRFRRHLAAYWVARQYGIEDEGFVEVAERLSDAIAAVDRLPSATPFFRADALSDRLGFDSTGGVWVKDETGNVAGSHKARHLIGLMLFLQVVERAGLDTDPTRPLAIASCGNAALAAAVVAKAARRTLHVFVPTDAQPAILTRLAALGACVHACPRTAGVTGDPCYHQFREHVRGGMIPFTCQGSENGLTIDGGTTIVHEMAATLSAAPADRFLVQVGGGALASSCWRALEQLHRRNILPRLPILHAVQTRGAFPLVRAYERLAGGCDGESGAGDRQTVQPRADRVPGERAADVDARLAYARRHRSAYMWPWEQEPRSVASGILDDETYDWAAVAEGMLRTGGSPVIADEQTLIAANELTRDATGVTVSYTGSAGLAGLLKLISSRIVNRPERVVVLFTGAGRS